MRDRDLVRWLVLASRARCSRPRTASSSQGGAGPAPVPLDRSQRRQGRRPWSGARRRRRRAGRRRSRSAWPATRFWPKSVIAWLVLSVVFLLLSVQFVSPTRRWRLRRDAGDDRCRPHERVPGATFAARAPGRSGPADRASRPIPRARLGGPARSGPAPSCGPRCCRIDVGCGSGGSSGGPGSRWPRVAVAELVLWTLARFVPLAAAPRHRRGDPARRACSAGWSPAIRARPGLGETALAVDVEGRLGDRLSSALELAVEFPASARPAAGRRRRRDGRGRATGRARPRPTVRPPPAARRPRRRRGSSRRASSRPASRGAGRGAPWSRRCCSCRSCSSRTRRTP